MIHFINNKILKSLKCQESSNGTLMLHFPIIQFDNNDFLFIRKLNSILVLFDTSHGK